jgi:hypothetical protein
MLTFLFVIAVISAIIGVLISLPPEFPSLSTTDLLLLGIFILLSAIFLKINPIAFFAN